MRVAQNNHSNTISNKLIEKSKNQIKRVLLLSKTTGRVKGMFGGKRGTPSDSPLPSPKEDRKVPVGGKEEKEKEQTVVEKENDKGDNGDKNDNTNGEKEGDKKRKFKDILKGPHTLHRERSQ